MKSNDLTAYVDRLYRAALCKTGDAYAAEELAQETFLAALSALSKGQEPEHVWAWLYRIMSNIHCDRLRDKYNKPQISFDDVPFDIPEETFDDDSEETLADVRRALGYLAKTHREVMVRFYMRGETIEQIAQALRIPSGTVKSRLNTGRKQIREGVEKMKTCTKQSYAPELLHLSCSGAVGLNKEPFSLVESTDTLAQNVLLLAYEKPVTAAELANALGTPAAFIEPILERLLDGELMKRTDGGRVHTDFIFYSEKDRTATFQAQLALVSAHFELFWRKTAEALGVLRTKPYYGRQSAHGKAKLELHFCIKLLMNAKNAVRSEITGEMPYSEYPYRKNGGRWIAMGQRFASVDAFEKERAFRKYAVSGEAGIELKRFRDAKYLALRKYDTSLGGYPNEFFQAEYVKWLYELASGVSADASSVGAYVLEASKQFIESGILRRSPALALDIPTLSPAEYRDECELTAQYEPSLRADIRERLLPVFRSGYVKLPPHLKGVPKWQQYLFCGDSVPMAVLYKAQEKGLFLQDVDYPLPAAVLVAEK